MRLITLCVLAMLPFCSFAGPLKTNGRLHFNSAFFVKVAPLHVLDMKGGVLPISVEYCFSKNWGVQAEAAIPLLRTISLPEGNYGYNKKITSDYRFGVEARRYFALPRNCRAFAAFEAVYRRQDAELTDRIYSPYRDREYHQYSTARNEKRLYNFATGPGISLKLFQPVFLEFALVAGVQLYDVRFEDVTDDTIVSNQEVGTSYFTNVDEISGHVTRFYFSPRMRISFLLVGR